MIIVLDGMDCAGKSTLSRAIYDTVYSDSYDGDILNCDNIHFPTERGYTSADEFMRDFRLNFPWEQSNRRDLLIVVDRMWMSTAVYQGLDIGSEWVYYIDRLLPIEQTYILHVDIDTWHDRLDQESINVFKQMWPRRHLDDIYDRMSKSYKRLAASTNSTVIENPFDPIETAQLILKGLA